MRKKLRFAALTAVIVLTFWLAQVNQAHALPPCPWLHGDICDTTRIIYCTDCDYACSCVSGHWECGCLDGDESLLLLSSAAQSCFSPTTNVELEHDLNLTNQK